MDFVRALWAREPARVVARIAAAIVFVAAKTGVVISEQDLLPALALVLPFVLGGEAVRGNVTPVAKLAAPADQIPPDLVDRSA